MSFLKDVLRGIAIGVANIIPGVSGGTMMVSMGGVSGFYCHMQLGCCVGSVDCRL